MGSHRLTVTAAESRQRLDRLLSGRFPELSRSYLQKLIREGHVTLAGRAGAPLRARRAMLEGEMLEVEFPPPEATSLTPEPRPLAILHQDAQIVVIDKPAGLVVHPGAGARSGTLVHALLHHCRDLSGIGGVERPGIVHRLDKETSGVLVVAKNDAAHRALASQFEARTIEKLYLALVWGRLGRPSGEIDVPIGRDIRQRMKISRRTARPREAFTQYRVVEEMPGFSWVEVRPRTGRTHQIRVHLKLIGHPIVGDAAYGGVRWKQVADAGIRSELERFGRLALHARRIGFRHPATGERVAFEAPVPDDLERLLRALRA